MRAAYVARSKKHISDGLNIHLLFACDSADINSAKSTILDGVTDWMSSPEIHVVICALLYTEAQLYIWSQVFPWNRRISRLTNHCSFTALPPNQWHYSHSRYVWTHSTSFLLISSVTSHYFLIYLTLHAPPLTLFVFIQGFYIPASEIIRGPGRQPGQRAPLP